MSRLRADFLLLITALIWGTAFVAQKNAFADVGALTFVAARFFISAVLVLPFALREYTPELKSRIDRKEIILLCAAFCAGVILQQIGIGKTSVTNAGFLTGLYVVFVPVICMLAYQQKLSVWIFLASFLSIAGIWLLSGGSLEGVSYGDVLVLACAACFALQVTLLSKVMHRLKAPFILSFVQYAAVTLVAALGAALFEHPAIAGIRAASIPILYAGVLSGGVAYTLQSIAQQYAPAPDSAVILSSESVFAAIAGALLIGERLTPVQYAGCGLIILAIILTELAPLFFRRGKNNGRMA